MKKFFFLAILIHSNFSFGLDAQKFSPLNSLDGGITVFTPKRNTEGIFEFGLEYNFAKNPLEFGLTSNNKRVDDLLIDLSTVNFNLSYTYKRISFILGVPYNFLSSYEAPYSNKEKQEKGFGDLSLLMPVYLGKLGKSINFKLIPKISTRSGLKKLFLGKQDISYGLGFAAGKSWSRSDLNFNMFYTKRKNEKIYNLEIEDSLNFSLGYIYDIGKKDRYSLISEIIYENPIGIEKTSVNAPLEILGSLRYQKPDTNWTFNFGGGKGLNYGYGSPDYRLFAGLSYKILKNKKDKKKKIKKEVKIFKEVEVLEREVFVTLEKIHFKTGSHELKEESYIILDRLSDILSYYEEIKKIRIDGHTDSVGDFMDNISLSKRRADSVAEYLISKGISKKRLIKIGYGESKPIDTNKTEYGRWRNRRVEFTVMELDSKKSFKFLIKEK